MELLVRNHPSAQSFPLLSEYYREYPHDILLDVCGGMCFLCISVYVYILYIFIIYIFIHKRK